MSRLQKIIFTRAALIAAFLLGGCMSFVNVDVTGQWQGTLTWIDGPSSGFNSPISLILVHESRDVSGTVTLMGPGSQPFDLTITDGRTNARSIRLQASGMLTLVTPSLNVSTSLDGDFDDNNMSGTGSQTIEGSTYQFTWELVRISGPPES